MVTNKNRRSKKRRSKKNINELDHRVTKTKHRRHKRHKRHRRNSVGVKLGLFLSSRDYESYAPENTNINANKANKGNIVNGLRDFLAVKKNK